MPIGDPPNVGVATFTGILPFAQQGWQCPCCHRCYSPTTVMCMFCPTQPVYTNESSTAGKGANDGQ